MPSKQKTRPVAHPSRRQRATQDESGNTHLDRPLGMTPREKVRAWINRLDPYTQDIASHETDIYRGHKRKARDEEVIDLVSDAEEIERPSSKKLKTLALASQLRKRVTSHGRNKDEDRPDTVPTPSRTYIVISDSEDDGGAPLTPTPQQRTAMSVNRLGSVRGQSVGSEQARSQHRTHPRSGLRTSQQATEFNGLLRGQQPAQTPFQAPQWLLQQPVSQGVQQDAQNDQPVARRLFQQAQPSQDQFDQQDRPGITQDVYRGPRTSNRAQQLPFRPVQNGIQDPFQQGVQQVIDQVVHQPQYLVPQGVQQVVQDAVHQPQYLIPQGVQQVIEEVVHQPQYLVPQDDQHQKRALREELEKTAQNFFTRAQVSPQARKTKATPRKKTQNICSSLPDGYFCSLPSEIRQNILRYLLISNKPIQVSKIWTDVARAITRRVGRGRQQHDEDEDEMPTTIDARILSVCRQVHLEGSRVLYSENTFFYKLRDGDSVPHYALTTASPMGRRPRDTGRIQNWHAPWLAANKGNPINFERYGPLLRHLRIELEPNRSTDEKYENLLVCALEALVSRPGLPISLHSLSLSISPSYTTSLHGVVGGARYLSTATFFAPGHRVMRALSQITTNYLVLNVHVDLASTITAAGGQPAAMLLLPGIDDDDDENNNEAHRTRTRHLEMTIDMRFTPRHMAAVPPSDAAGADLWVRDALMPAARKARGQRAETCLAQLRRRIEGACADPDEAIRRNWFDDAHDAEYLRMNSVTGWWGTSEVEGADEIEDRILIVRFGNEGGRMRATKV